MIVTQGYFPLWRLIQSLHIPLTGTAELQVSSEVLIQFSQKKMELGHHFFPISWVIFYLYVYIINFG